ncbi:MAG: helix-turn-helix domain-containing protein [Bacillota bacterium]
MGEIGESLRKAREEKGLSLRQVEEATKIRTCYLDALENEDFQRLPGLFYAQGFIRSYARFLGLDAEQWIQNLHISGKEMSPTPIQSDRLGVASRPRSRKKAISAIIICAAVVLLGILIYQSPKEPGAKVPASPNAQNSSEQQENGQGEEIQPTDDVQGKTGKEQSPAPVFNGVEIKLAVTNDRSWLSVFSDGKEVFEGTIYAGEEKTFRGEEKVSIRYGKPWVVRVVHNGQDLGFAGEPSRAITREYNRSP